MTTIEDIKQQVREIIELADKATQKEWHAVELTVYADSGEVACTATTGRTVEDDRHNAHFITACRNLTPKMARALLMAIENLELIHESSPMGEYAAWDALETIRREWDVQL
jgi:hypothetical protein